MPDTSQDSARAAAQPDGNGQSPAKVQTIARRKAILKALGRTAAVAGAVSPLSSLAAARLRYESNGKSYNCSVSGNMSVLHSASTESTPVCSGKRLSEYQSRLVSGNRNAGDTSAANWPAWPNKLLNSVSTAVIYTGSGFSGTAYNPTAMFNQIFGGSDARKIGEMVNDNVPDAHWVIALLNANRFPTTFPHTAEQVIAQYADPAKRAVALSFYSQHVNKG